jgi:cyclophilin family peptidyl-prolyl cis-trans isomerase
MGVRADALLRIAVALTITTGGCDRVVAWMDGEPPAMDSAGKPTLQRKRTKRPRQPAELVKADTVRLKKTKTVGVAPSGVEDLATVLTWLRTRASVGETRDMATRIPQHTLSAANKLGPAVIVPIAPPHVRRLLAGKPQKVRYNGGRAVVTMKQRGRDAALWFFARGGRWLWDLQAPRQYRAALDGAKHAMNRPLSLTQTLDGIHGTGPLVAILDTSAGVVRCKLETSKTPASIAHFVGLARGLRATLDASVTPAVWVRVPVYDGTSMKAAAGGLAIVGGRLGNGAQAELGFTIADELDVTMRHDRPGVLGLLNNGPNTTAGGLYVALRPAPELDDRYTTIGLCRDLDTLRKLTQGAGRLLSVRVRRGF